MNKFNERKQMRGQGGFTLIELLVVVAILAVLGGAAIIGIGAMRSNSELQVCKTDKETIETALEAQRVATNATGYTTIANLVSTGYLKRTPKGTWTISTGGAATPTAYGALTAAELSGSATSCNGS